MKRPHDIARYLLGSMTMLLLTQAVRANDGFEFTSQLEEAYSTIQKLRLEPARRMLDAVKSKQPNNGFLPYLESYSEFFYFLITDDEGGYSSFSKRQEERIQRLSKRSKASPYQRMLMAEVRLHSAFVKLKFGNRTSGCWDIVKANRLLNENRKLFPDFLPQLKSSGLLQVMIGSVPDEYQWVARLMGLRGNIGEGLAELQRVEKEVPLFSKEAQVISLLLNAYVLHPDEKVLAALKKLPVNEPDNLLFHFLSASILMKRGESQAAFAILAKAPSTSDYVSFAFLHYMKAEVNLQKGRYERAQAEYAAFIRQTKGSNFVKDAYFKQYIAQWLAGHTPQDRLLAKVAAVGSQHVEADKYAHRTAIRFQASGLPKEQRVLYKARYAFDGGFTAEALAVLNRKSEESFQLLHSKVEYTYRMGRILQKQGQLTACIPFLVRTVEMTASHDFYFGPSAALQLGYIHQQIKEPQKAEVYFKKALSFKKHEYKSSIDNKARAALTEMQAGK